MKIEPEAYAILAIIGVVLLPMWAIALASGEPAHAVSLAENVEPIVPTETFLPSPREINENVAGVITWVALFVLVAMIVYTRRFVTRIGEDAGSVTADDGDAESAVADGSGPSTERSASSDGEPRGLPDGGTVDVPSYLTAGHRRITEYFPATMEMPGMIAVGLFSWTAVTFAALLVWEGIHLARTQFLGVYAGMMFLSMGALVAVYASWFLPNVTVAEPREVGVDDE